MLPANQSLADLRARFAHAGRLEWIGLRPERGRIECVTRAELALERGLLGDHHAAQVGGKRQVTLIQFEHLIVVAALCGRGVVSPALLRRNLAVSGINLLALHERRFRIGSALLKGKIRPRTASRDLLTPDIRRKAEQPFKGSHSSQTDGGLRGFRRDWRSN